jgi:hypothetical protein
MTKMTLTETDELVRYSRRSLWTCLLLILLFGLPAALSIGFPDTAAGGLFKQFSTMFPIVIIVALAALKSSAKRARTDPSGPAMRAILHDELRGAAVNRAYRNAFMGVMVLQPVLAVWLTRSAMPDPLAFSTCVTVLLGVVVLLASILAYDR